ncbi:ABC transporter ATP-binding protein [Martelella sp. HB161492]|uniref:polyamine ABC transporter ATP-binding protein n=1 Tax=Martelella sp. HB161492 TaxID=2720726 RepID=UPI00158FA8BA
MAARALFKSFGDFTALKGVDIAIRENEFFTLLGPSGCGKTTLLRLIAGFEMPDDGLLYLDGAEISGLAPNRRPVNTVFQNYALFPHMSVAENIGFGLSMLGRPRSEIADTVTRMLKLVKMEHLAGRRPAALSGGQQQRIALARALAPSPKVLLLDEPLSALDYKLRKEMQSELKKLQEETGITFIFVTHDQEEALAMSDRIAVMNAGKILQTGTPAEIYDAPADRFVADFIGESNFLDATVISTNGHQAMLRIKGGGLVSLSVFGGVQPGNRLTLAIRPEHVVLRSDPTEGSWPGTVKDVTYFGAGSNVTVGLDGGTVITARLTGRPPENGVPVFVGLPADHLRHVQD